MEFYLTECCDAKPITYLEEKPVPNYSDSLQNQYTYIMGMCSECKEWSDCYADEEHTDWADEIEYINNHLEENK